MNINEINKMEVSKIKSIIDLYYNAVANNGNDTFTEKDISDMLNKSECTDPYNVPFGDILYKYCEEEIMLEKMQDAEYHTSLLMYNMCIWKYQKNLQKSHILSTGCNGHFAYINKILSSNVGKIMYTKWYNDHKNEMYMKGLQMCLNTAYYAEWYECNTNNTTDAEVTVSLSEYRFTDKLIYDMPDDFNVLNMTYKSLDTFMHNNYMESCNCITVEEALSNIPDDTRRKMENIAIIANKLNKTSFQDCSFIIPQI